MLKEQARLFNKIAVTADLMSILAALYASLRIRPLNQIAASILKVHAVGGIVTASAIYLIDPHGFSRGLFGYFLCYSFIIIALGKTVLKYVLSILRRKGYNFRYILIVGTNGKARRVAELVEQHRKWGLKVAGFLSHKDEPPNAAYAGFAKSTLWTKRFFASATIIWATSTIACGTSRRWGSPSEWCWTSTMPGRIARS